jgi:hypothetical protein
VALCHKVQGFILPALLGGQPKFTEVLLAGEKVVNEDLQFCLAFSMGCIKRRMTLTLITYLSGPCHPARFCLSQVFSEHFPR